MSVTNLSVFVPFACLLAGAVAQTPGVLVDINQTGSGPIGSSPFGFTTLGSLVLFSATTQAHGAELWAADLATNAVYLLADVAPGTASSAPDNLIAMGGRIYFVADDGVHGRELWSTDGTTAGTRLVVDLAPGGSSLARDLVVAGGRLFFSAYTTLGSELVVSDGTAAGTQVIDINPSGHSLPGNLTPIQNEVWFKATTPGLGAEPWRSDGTPGGTTLVMDTVAGASGGFPESFTPVGNRVLFVSNVSAWTSDGTAAGTSVLLPGASKLLGAGGFAYLMIGGSIYRSDGTVANTQQVASVPVQTQLGELVTQFTPFGAHFVIRVQGGLGSSVDSTWLCDGTAAGTVQLPGIAMQSYAADGNTLWFGSSSGDGAGNELWRTDGTVAGTVRIADIVPGPGHSTPQALAVIAPGAVMFSAVTATGREPWRSNGTALGTLPLANIALEVTQSANPAEVVDAAGRLFFRAYDGTVETLWTSDGTAAGTHAVVPAGPSQPQNVERVVGLGDRVFFRGNTAATGSEVMVTDGTAAGTNVIDTWPGPDSSNPSSMVAAADRLYFLSYNPWGSRSLWQTNGTVTVSISAPVAVGTIAAIGAFGRGLVFAFNPGAGAGSEPWYTDGTVAGTVPLGDLLPGLDSSEPTNIVAFGGRCFFTARNVLGSSKQLWVTDGTAAGTQLFLAGVPGAPTHFDRLAVVRDRLFFAARDPANGLELWVSDGAQAGTHLVLDAVPGPSGLTPFEPRPFGDLLLYRVTAAGIEGLWRSDGTAAGTFRVSTIQGTEVRAAGERHAWFLGYDAAAGNELWRTDGTVAGTARFADLLPGDGSSQPSDLALSNGRLYFAAMHEGLGRELWSLDLDATTQPIGFGCAFGGAVPSRLWGDDPAMGTTATFRVVDAPPIGISVALFTHFVAGHLSLGPGCDLFVDFNPLILGVELFQGGAAAHLLGVPVNPALDDQLFRVQVLTLSGTTVLELGLSNALTLTIGN